MSGFSQRLPERLPEQLPSPVQHVVLLLRGQPELVGDLLGGRALDITEDDDPSPALRQLRQRCFQPKRC
jgi:uncharacterized protein (DUF2249 family)